MQVQGPSVLACGEMKARACLLTDQVKGLLERGADPAAVDKQNVSALHFACGQGRLQVVQYLWSRGVEVDCEDSGADLLPLQSALLESSSADT